MAVRQRPLVVASYCLLATTLSAPVLVAREVGPQQRPPAQPGPVQTKGPCRTYDTAVTAVTVGGPMRVTLEISGVFDPWSLRMVQNVSFSSNQGSNFSYVQTSSWDSVDDFIAEADVIPPLTRSRSTRASGQIGLNKTNTFDGTNRLTGFQTRSQGGTITVRYTAWDALGRPTAGTMQSPAQSSTLQISYDDKALTQTERTTTRNLTSTMTTAFDQHGNIRSIQSTVTGGQGSTTTWTSHSSATVCLGDRQQVKPVAAKPGASPNGTFSGTIGGQSWTASMGVHADNMAPVVSVGGGDGRYLVSIGVAAKPGPGQYRAGPPPDDVDFTKMTPEQFKDLFDHNTVVATVTDTVTKQAWQASPTIGKGTVNLTSVSGAAAGTFSLTLDAVPGTGASGSIGFSGSFNIRF